MPRCPAGHASTSTDYCDDCGAPLASAPTPPPATPAVERCAGCGGPRSGRFCEECGHDSLLPNPGRGAHAAPDPTPLDPSPLDDPTPLDPGLRDESFEAAGGRGSSAPSGPADPSRPAAQPDWVVTVRADQAWFEEMRRTSAEPPALRFPPYCPERRFALTGDQLVIGRRNRARGVDPEIDLSGPPLDPGVSTLHAVLLRRDDGGWALVDMGSTNGTVVGDGVTPIPANTPVALADGDRIKIGAWTTLTVTVGPAG